MEQPKQELRKVARHRVLKGAHISFKGHGLAIACTVRNLSDGRARLKVASPIGIPDTFDLVLDDATTRPCRVTRRKSALRSPRTPGFYVAQRRAVSYTGP
jgi:hypothetical protein